jgi:hypothetical protein
MAQMAIDRTTAEIFNALDAAGVAARLLKGPSIARWLYDDPDERPYGDTDLLVPSSAEPEAEAVLRGLGFAPDTGTGEPDPEGVALNHIWSRGEEMAELHLSLIGIRAPRAAVWEQLSADPEAIAVGGREVPVLRRPARALHLALHAAQHGRAEAKPLDDLRRGLDREPDSTWREAAALAERLDAAGAFATGLRLIDATLPERIGLEAAIDPDAELRAQNEDLALGIGRLAKLPTRRAKVARLARVIFPSPTFMRWWTPLARRGVIGLALSYPWRLVWLVRKGPSALRAWRRANQ